MKAVCIDLETTSRSPKENEIIEIGLVKIENNNIIETKTWCIKPKLSVPNFIFKLTGITQNEINNAATFDRVAGEIKKFIGPTLIVAHNANFDIGQLNKSFTDYGFETLKNNVIDTQNIAKILYPTLKSYKQEHLLESLNIEQNTHHRALDDAKGVAKLFLKMCIDRQVLKDPVKNLIYRHFNSNEDLKNFLIPNYDDHSTVPIEEFKHYIISTQKPYNRKTSGFEEKTIEELYDELSTLNGYTKRPQQHECSQFIANVINNNKHGLVEAETGSGKTCAYLIPAALKSIKDEQPAIIATKTKLLQNQIYYKDGVAINKLFNHQLKISVLKGKENYCDIKQIDRLLPIIMHSSSDNIDWVAIMNWLLSTETGELDELHPSLYERFNLELKYAPQHRRHIPHPNSFYKYAKEKAKHANIVITNQALLLNDYIGGHQTLPNPCTVIIDEAHNLDSVATSCVSIRIDKQRVNELLHMLSITGKQSIHKPINRQLMSQNDTLNIETLCNKLDQSVHKIELLFKTWQDSTLYLHNPDKKRFGRKTQIIINEDCLSNTKWQSVSQSHNELSNEIGNSKALLNSIKSGIENLDIEDQLSVTHMIDNAIDCVEFLKGDIDYILSADIESVAWIEINEKKYSQYVSFHCTPIFCNNILADQLFEKLKSSICCSATLSVNKSFEFFTKLIGLNKLENTVQTIQINSDFNHSKQAKVMCVNSSIENTQSLSNKIAKCARAFKGKTLALFTAFETLLDSKIKVQKQLHNPYMTVIAQSPESQTNSLITKFKSEHFPSVLMGVDSFWEGMDIKGPALTCLIITKLPFHVPTDPLHFSRLQYYAKQNENGFKEYTLPLAILKLKQGIGRLIRSKNDQGIIFILDPRLTQKSYKKCFIREIDYYPIEEGDFDELLNSSISWYHKQQLTETSK